jgi:hypothetical protein
LLPGRRWFDPSRRSLALRPARSRRAEPGSARLAPPSARGLSGLCSALSPPAASPWRHAGVRGAIMPRSSSGRGRRSLTPEARVRFPLGAPHDTLSDASGTCGPAVSRVRRVRFPSRALLAVAQWMSAALLPRAMGVRLLPARLRRKACSEPAGCESVEQGAIPWRRLCIPRVAARADFRSTQQASTTGRLGKRRSDTAVERGSIPRSSTSRTPPGPRPGPLAVGEMATPPVLGTGDRWFDSSRPDLFVARWRSGFLASLMSSRRGFESHPRYLVRTLSTGELSAL